MFSFINRLPLNQIRTFAPGLTIALFAISGVLGSHWNLPLGSHWN